MAPPAMSQGGATYQYDNLGRLTKVTFADGSTIKYQYDEAGNRTSVQVCCSDQAKLTTGDLMSDWLVSGLVATTPTALADRFDAALTLPASVGLSDDDSLLWINTTKDLGSGQTAYNTLAFSTSANFSTQLDCSDGTDLTPEGISSVAVPNTDMILSAVKVSGGTGHAFFAVTASTGCGTPVSLSAANVFAAVSPDGSKAAFALADNTVALSMASNNFSTVTSTFPIGPNPLSITFDGTGTKLWISYAGTSVIEQYDLTGTLLQSFDIVSTSPDYKFLRAVGDSLVISSQSDKKIFVVDATIPALSATIDLVNISPREMVVRSDRAYVLGLDSTDSHYKIIRFTIGSVNFDALDTGLTAPTAGLAVSSNEMHAYTISGGTPAVTHDFALPADTIPPGVAYVDGQRVVTFETPHQYAPSKDTYQFLQSDGTNHFLEVANGGAQPTDTGLLISKTVTNDLGITSITQIAPAIPTIAGYARSGANSDITSLNGLTTPLSLSQGGTGNNLSGASAGALPYLNGSGGMNSMAAGSANTVPVWDGSQWTPQTYGGGGGTVTSVSSGNLSPLFTTSVTDPTTTPTISFSLSNFPPHSFFGNNAGLPGVPSAIQPSFADLSGTATTGQLPSSVVLNDANNTFSGTHTQDFSSSGQTLRVPTKSDPSSPISSEIWLSGTNGTSLKFRDNAGTPATHIVADDANTVSAGTGLTGGGSLTSNPTLSLDVPVSVTNGGTGASTASGARSNLSAAASGANSDITSLTGLTTPLSVGQGGTGASTAAAARDNLGALSSTLTDGHVFVGNGSNIATDVAVTGDASISNLGAVTVTKTNGTPFAASATTDTTNAANITSGSLPAARLPNPTSSTLGGVQSAAAQTHQWIDSISTSGVPNLSQPAFPDISGVADNSQLPTSVVHNNASNAYTGTTTQDFSSANTTLKLPTKADPGSPVNAEVWLSGPSSSSLKFRDNGSTPATHTVADDSNTITAGTGLTGGGSLTSNPTLSLDVPVSVADGGTGAGTASGARANLGAMSSSLTDSHILVGNGSNIATDVAVSGDVSISNTGAVTVTKTNGTPFAASATTDTTNAANITSGTLPASRLPNPTSTTLGGVQSAAGQAHQWVDSISTSGEPHQSQPAFADISGSASAGQLPANVVYNDASNTYSGTTTQDFSASGTTLKLPTKNDPVSPVAGEVWLSGAAGTELKFRDNAGSPATHSLVDASRQFTAGTGLTGGGDLSADRSIEIASTGVTPGSYSAANVTVNAQGQITAASNGSVVTSVTNADGTLAVSQATGNVVVSIPSNVALPGSPTTTTQSPGDSSTKIATTGFVSDAVSSLNSATAAATANTLVKRDANARAQVSDPVAAQDIATKSYVDSHAGGAPATQYITSDTILTASSPAINVVGLTSFTKDVTITLPDASTWVGKNPLVIARDGTGGKYVASQTKRISSGALTNPASTFSTDNTYLYYQNAINPANIVKYNTITWNQTATTGSLGSAFTIGEMSLSDDGNLLYFTNSSNNSLNFVNTSNLSSAGSLTVGASGTGRCLKVDATNAYMTTSIGLYKINLSTGIATQIASSSSLYGLAITPSHIFVVDAVAELIRVFRISDSLEVASIPGFGLAAGNWNALTIDATRNRLWFCTMFGSVCVYDIANPASPTKLGTTATNTSTFSSPGFCIDSINGLMWVSGQYEAPPRAYNLASNFENKAPEVVLEVSRWADSATLNNLVMMVTTDGSPVVSITSGIYTHNVKSNGKKLVNVLASDGQLINNKDASITLFEPEDSVGFVAVQEGSASGWVVTNFKNTRAGSYNHRVVALPKRGMGLQDLPNDAIVVQMADGTLWGWGDCTAPGLLNGATAGSAVLRPILWQEYPSIMMDLRNTSIVDWCYTGGNLYAVMDNGQLWGGGANASGQLCDGTTAASTVMKYIGGGLDTGIHFTKIWAYSSNGGNTNGGWMAATANNKLYGAGYNNNGQVGIGTTTNVNTVTLIHSFSTQIANVVFGQDYGQRHVLVVADGGLWGCGWNGNGALGDNTVTQATTLKNLNPTLNVGATVVKAFASGGYGTAYTQDSYYLTSDGQLYGAGDNSVKQLGDNSTTDSHVWKNIPTPSIPGIDTSVLFYTDLVLGNGVRPQCYGFLNDGHIAAWGYNGQQALFSTGTTAIGSPTITYRNFVKKLVSAVGGGNNANPGQAILLGYADCLINSGEPNNVITETQLDESFGADACHHLPRIPQLNDKANSIVDMMLHGSAATQRLLVLTRNGDLWINGDNSNGFVQGGLSYSTTLTKIGWTKLRID